jgi:hypothetical protein
MCVQPALVLEKSAKQRRDLPMMVSFGAWRERAGIAQNIASMLKEFSFAVERSFLREVTGNRWHVDQPCRAPGDAGGSQVCHSGFVSRWSILTAFMDLIAAANAAFRRMPRFRSISRDLSRFSKGVHGDHSRRGRAVVQLQAPEAIAYGERHPHRFSYT